MRNIKRPAPFVLISSNHGTMIINRNDYHLTGKNSGFGLSFSIMQESSCNQPEVDLALELLSLRRHYFGDGVIAIDCGANLGTCTIEWARLMHTWGNVYSFEAQEKIFYALAGNIIINNCLNVTARLAAVGSSIGEIEIPTPNYLIPSSFGSLELKRRTNTEFIGQNIDYANHLTKVPQITLDSLSLKRIDFIKIDVEGMEEEVLTGSSKSIKQHKPILFIEIIKSNKDNLHKFVKDNGYTYFDIGMNMLAIHNNDPCLKNLTLNDNIISLNKPKES